MLCSILHRYIRFNSEHQMSGLNQKTSKGINFLSSFLSLTNTFLEFFEGADEILFDLLLVTTFRNVEMGDAVREDRLQSLSSFFRIRRRLLALGLATFGIRTVMAFIRIFAFRRHGWRRVGKNFGYRRLVEKYRILRSFIV